MCRRRNRDSPTRHAFPPTKLAAQSAAHHAAIRRQRAGSLSAIPPAARPRGLESARTAARAAMAPGFVWVSGRAHYRGHEVRIGFESGRRRNLGEAGRAMLFRGTFRFAVFALADWRRYFAIGHGFAREPQQGGRGAGEPGGSDHRFYFAGAAGGDWRAAGAAVAGRAEPKDLPAGCSRRRCRRGDRGNCGGAVSSAAIFLPYTAEIGAAAARLEVNMCGAPAPWRARSA